LRIKYSKTLSPKLSFTNLLFSVILIASRRSSGSEFMPTFSLCSSPIW